MDSANEEVRAAFRPVFLVGVVVAASLAVYLGLVEVLRAVLRPFRGWEPEIEVRPLRFAAFGAAVAVILLIRFVRPVLLKRRAGEGRKASILRLQRASFLTLLLAEIPAVLGVVLFVLAGHNVDFYALLVASLILVFMYFPRWAAWEDWLRNLS